MKTPDLPRLLQPPNARIWLWLNDGWVKLTLQPDQPLNHAHSCHHDEGWSAEYFTWTWDGHVLVEEHATDGRDCDGRHSTHSTHSTTPDRFRAHPARRFFNNLDPRLPDYEMPVPDIAVPEWTRGKCRQRDYSAEAMGY
jgi:hypothetical protein